jgi:alkylhydroperoxidase family enzyme
VNTGMVQCCITCKLPLNAKEAATGNCCDSCWHNAWRTPSAPQAAKPEIAEEDRVLERYNRLEAEFNSIDAEDRIYTFEGWLVRKIMKFEASPSSIELVEAARAYVATVEDKTAGTDACNKAFDVLRRALAALVVWTARPNFAAAPAERTSPHATN